jgi:hypothetical protein
MLLEQGKGREVATEHRIGEILVEMKACSPQELQAGLQTQAIFGGRLGTNLLELGIVDGRQLARALSTAHGVPCLDDATEPDEGAIAALTREQVERFEVIPIQLDDRRLRVAVVDPRNLASLDDLAFATSKRIEVMVAPEARLWTLMRKHYGIERQLRGLEVDDELEVAPGREAALGRVVDERTRAISHQEALRLVATMEDPVVLSAVLVRGAASSVGRAVFLKAHPDHAVAWLGSGRLLEGDVRGAEVPLAGEETIFGAALALRAPVLAPVTPSRATARFFQRLHGPLPMNAYVAPVLLRGRAVALLYADLGPGGTLREEALELLALSTAVNRRFETLSPVAS